MTPQAMQAPKKECHLCNQPYPYNCQECLVALNMEEVLDTAQERISIASGEDCYA